MDDSKPLDVTQDEESHPDEVAFADVTQDEQGNPIRPVQVSGTDQECPERIGRYRIEKMLGQGGFGLVYLAHDEKLQRPVAVNFSHGKSVGRLSCIQLAKIENTAQGSNPRSRCTRAVSWRRHDQCLPI